MNKMSVPNLCTKNTDCPPNFMCFADTSWFDSQEISNEQTNSSSLILEGCACNTMYGWTGENCDEYTLNSVIWIVSGALLLTINISSLIVTSIALKLNYEKYGQFKMNPGMSTTLIMIPASIGGIMWSLSQFGSALAISGPFLGPAGLTETDAFKGRFNIFGLLGSGLAGGFGAAGSVVISLMWLDIASKVKFSRFVRTGEVEMYRKIIYGFFATGLLAALLGVIFERVFSGSNVLGLVLVPHIFMIMVCYIWGAYKFTKVLNDSESLGGSYSRSRSTFNIPANGSVNESERGSEDFSDSNLMRKKSSFEILRKKSSFEFRMLSKPSTRSSRLSVKTSGAANLKPVIRLVRNTTISMAILLLIFGTTIASFSSLDLVYGFREINNPDNPFSYIKIIYLIEIFTMSIMIAVITRYVFGNASVRKKTERRKTPKCSFFTSTCRPIPSKEVIQNSNYEPSL